LIVPAGLGAAEGQTRLVSKHKKEKKKQEKKIEKKIKLKV
jgi:hypothetical protein